MTTAPVAPPALTPDPVAERPALVVRGLHARYPGARRGQEGTAVLHGVDLTADAGTLLAVLGPSGCGKTTLLRVVAGLLPATDGHVTLGDRVLVDGPDGLGPEHRRIGLVPQDAALFPHRDVAGNIAFGLRRRGVGGTRWDAAARRRRVDELLDVVGLAGTAHRLPHELSGGQRQRVALARALAPRPDLVLLDEPFSALDASLRTGLRTEVREILHHLGATAVLVTHDQDEALSMADRVVVLRDGRVVQDDAPVDLYERPADPWVAQFLGDSVTLPGRWDGRAVQTALGPLAPAVAPVALARPAVRVVLRPEQLRLEPAGSPTGTAAAGTVTRREYFGHDALFHVRLDEGTGEQGPGSVLVRTLSGSGHQVGDRVVVGVEGPVIVFDG
ncbi:ABC transporter ATP-binding protein [Oerskovia flava]|uniref:ABC transporter ATP-binding protein n=1 Tax=Oerskovia flava TaxID=2986422 RepID=UPI00223F845D|nr:ABC transporter ATP-binding protein [Oerskovia sp. JB1-3-2]